MKIETETAIRSIAQTDSSVAKELLERAIEILRGNAATDEDLVHVIKCKVARELLGVTKRTLIYYLDCGYLDRVYGAGNRAIGVSRESLFRFMNRRVVRNGKCGMRLVKVGRRPDIKQQERTNK